MTSALHLASASPRRADILRALGLRFSQGGADIDETPLAGEPPGDMVLRLAEGKARATQADAIVLAADTTVVLDGLSLGKPVDAEDAADMLGALSGRTHEVMTGVAVRAGESVQTVLSVSEVTFRSLSDLEIARYWASGEPRDKAGAYAIQGLGGLFVSGLRGSYSGVVGLPVYETAEMLRKAGLDVLQELSA